VPDTYNLQRFVDAQEPVFDTALAELKQGRKRGHWIWFIFPQLKGLGHSANSAFYGISGLPEATAFVKHPVLGPRLIECTVAVNSIEGQSAEDIFGEIDAMKFRSSMTLFAKAAPQNEIFANALGKYFAGKPDALTTRHLQANEVSSACRRTLRDLSSAGDAHNFPHNRTLCSDGFFASSTTVRPRD